MRPSPAQVAVISSLVVAVLVMIQTLVVAELGIEGHWLVTIVHTSGVVALTIVLVLLMRRLVVGPGALPLLPAHWQTRRTRTSVLGALLVLLLAMREGALGPRCEVGCQCPIKHERFSAAVHRGEVSMATKEPADDMSGRPLHWAVSCARPGPICEAAVAAMKSDASGPSPDVVTVAGTLEVEELGSSCYVPLYKRSDTPYRATLELRLATANTEKTAKLTIDGSVDQLTTGPISCLEHRRDLGEELGEEIVERLTIERDRH